MTTKVTYATLSSESDELHARFDQAFQEVRSELGKSFPSLIAGEFRRGPESLESYNPARTSQLLGRVAGAGPEDVEAAVQAAHQAYPGWRNTAWQARCRLLQRAAQIVRERRYELACWLVLENGKNRLEALGEIEETADLYDYYADQMERNNGYVRGMARLSPQDDNTSVLRPYGVWAVVAPFNFPYALLGAPMAAALVCGNTVVAKPSSETPIAGALVAEIFQQAGFPPGVANLVAGSGSSVGKTLLEHPLVAGVTFTGSYEVGFRQLFQKFSRDYPKPCLAEMGGKNAAIVSEHADLSRAAQGVYRSAFGMGGQKCSACARVLVHEKVADAFEAELLTLVRATTVGDPSQRGIFLGPVGVRSAYADYARYLELARRDGKVLAGREPWGEGPLSEGYFVAPAVVTDLPEDHPILREELFLPMLAIERVASLDQALERANRSHLGLTAGLFSQRHDEIEKFLDGIEAGVVYVNRAAGATTGAWPGVQPFGGWKGSGSSGKNIGGLYTLPCYMREQSRTVTA